MPSFNDLTGLPFGRLTVLSLDSKEGTKYVWRCKCKCGNVTYVRSGNLVTGEVESCGCLRLEKLREVCVTHDRSKTSEFQTWASILQRCCNPKNTRYYDYGGRGIKVCERWKNSFVNFLADMGARPKGLTIDRINNDGDYEPGNCRWTTMTVQNSNKRKPNGY